MITVSEQQPARRRPVRSAALGTAVVVVIAMLVTLGLRSTWVHHQLALSFTRLPENYTQLYFGDAPVRAASGRTQVDFTIDNRGQRTTRYGYRVQADDGDRPVGQTTGSVELAPGRNRVVRARLDLRGQDYTSVTVSLADRPEQIRYLRNAS